MAVLDGNRFSKIDGVVYVTEGDTGVRAVGNQRISVRRNGVEESGCQWGWEMCPAARASSR